MHNRLIRIFILLLAVASFVFFAAGALAAEAPAQDETAPVEDPTQIEEPTDIEEPTQIEEPACRTTGEHVPGVWTFDGKNKHTSVCTLCGEALEGACDYGSPTVYTPVGDGTHTKTCTVCGGTVTKACSYNEGKTAYPTQTEPGTLTRVCKKCGYTLTERTAEPEAARAASRLMGDVSGNGKVEGEDARSILRAAVQLETVASAQIPYADLDEDGKITAADARLALRTAVKLEPERRHEISVKVTKEPTCTATGSLTWSCAYCKTEETLTIPAKSHSWVEATPTAAKHCAVCGKKMTGWYTLGDKVYYYRADGTTEKGAHLFTAVRGGKNAVWYMIDGRLALEFTGIVTENGKSYYIKEGKVSTAYRGALTYGGKDWIVPGDGTAYKVTTAADRTLFRAFGEVAKATTPDMTKEQKLRACFVYCKTHYTERRPRTPHYTGIDWPVIYANDMFAGPGGNCCSYAAAFAYLAKAIGYENVYACNSGGHGWAEIDGRVYDPEWSKRDGLTAVTYYGLSYDQKCDVAYKKAISSNQPWMHVKI